MAVILSDEFTLATGLANLRVPTTAPVGSHWVSADMTQMGGVVFSDGLAMGDGYYAPATLTDSGSMSIDMQGTGLDTLHVAVDLKLGSVVTGGDSFLALRLGCIFKGRSFEFAIEYSGVTSLWTARVFDHPNPGVSVNITPLVAANGYLFLNFDVADGAQTISVENEVSVSPLVAADTVAYLDGTGLYTITVRIGGFCGVANVLAENSVVETSATADVSAPSPALLFDASDPRVHAVFDLSPAVPTVSMFSGAQCPLLVAPIARLSAAGHNSYGEQAAFLTAPSPQLTITTGANGRSTAPAPTLSSSGTVTSMATTTLSAPKPTLSATCTVTALATAELTTTTSPTLTGYTGAVAQLRTTTKPTLSAAVTVGSVARAAVKPVAPTLTSHAGAAASLRSPASTLTSEVLGGGLARSSLAAPSPNLVGYGGAVCSVSVTGSPTVQATGTTGGVASAQVTCPLFELTSTASIGNTASANLLAPSPRLGAQAQAWLTAPSARLTAIGSAVVTATYEAYAVNLGHRPRVTNQELPIDEVTHYTNFPFTHVVRYQNSYYGANSTGLYLLEGTTDDGTAIPWAVKTAMDDFKTPVKKTVAAAYFGGRFGPASAVQLHAGEDTPNTYSFSTPRDTLAQNHRQVFGKGVKERYYALGASGTGTVELDTIELETHNMTRRI